MYFALPNAKMQVACLMYKKYPSKHQRSNFFLHSFIQLLKVFNNKFRAIKKDKIKFVIHWKEKYNRKIQSSISVI